MAGQPGRRDQVGRAHPVQVRVLRHAVDLMHPVELEVERRHLADRASEHVDVLVERADPVGERREELRRPAQVGRLELEPALDVPRDVGADVVRPRGQQRAERGRVLQRPPDPETLVSAGQVRRRVDDLAAEVGEHLPGRRERGADRGIDREAAEVQAPGDPDAAQVTCQQVGHLSRIGEGRRRRVERERHPRVGAADHREEQGDVADCARHRPFDAQPVGHVGDRPGRHPAR